MTDTVALRRYYWVIGPAGRAIVAYHSLSILQTWVFVISIQHATPHNQRFDVSGSFRFPFFSYSAPFSSCGMAGNGRPLSACAPVFFKRHSSSSAPDSGFQIDTYGGGYVRIDMYVTSPVLPLNFVICRLSFRVSSFEWERSLRGNTGGRRRSCRTSPSHPLSPHGVLDPHSDGHQTMGVADVEGVERGRPHTLVLVAHVRNPTYFPALCSRSGTRSTPYSSHSRYSRN